ncbi:hypothetical protein SmJEL517_g05712 [Synchytrium microbalum]|uniref:Cytochrome P450 n=1 Tax=Synchytrium microbalum TaxID=1806994 RepID=A0A507BJR9_9FUNG|nr:uncharacterized protein SmJEL517_g05712 [Synchytrium microbalum]TPX30810.1 hypothetical protein SmJEL517_g05712 [Synchytrium microbalum]
MTTNKSKSVLPVVAAVSTGLTVSALLGLYLRYRKRAILTRDPAVYGVPVLAGAAPLVGNIPEMVSVSEYQADWLVEKSKEFGDIFAMTVPLQNLLCTFNVADLEAMLKDPYLWQKGPFFRDNLQQFLGHGIFNSDGDAWKNQRKVASNIFNVKNFRDLFSQVFVDESKKLASQIATAHSMGGIVELQDLLLRATMDSFTLIALGKSTDAIDGKGKLDNDGVYVLPRERFMDAFDGANTISADRFNMPFWEIWEYWDGTSAKMNQHLALIEDFAKNVINSKRAKMAEGQKGSDLLDLFMAQGDPETGAPLTDQQLRDITLNFIIAGRDTTAQTLSWTFWRLAQNPRVEKKCREEILLVLGKDGEYTYETFKDLKYTNATFMEALRLHANVHVNSKTASKDTVLPGTNTPIKAGDTVLFSPYVMGRDEKIWGADALEFVPERWIDKNGSLIKPNQFEFPHFNAGPRLCLGMSMAQQEAVVFMSTIIRKFSLELVGDDSPKHWGRWDPDPAKRAGRESIALTLNARNGITFKVHPV